MSIANSNLVVAIFVMLKILTFLFPARIELVNSRCLAPVKTKRTTERAMHNGQCWAFKNKIELLKYAL